jgi:enolase
MTRTKKDTRIENIIGRELLDSRGTPALEVEVVLTDGSVGRAMVPAGASTGSHEAVELRDNDFSRFGGTGVILATIVVEHEIFPTIQGMDARLQRHVDRVMISQDNTEDKAKFGANSMLGVSLAVAKAAANSLGQPLHRYLGGLNARVLPIPMINILNGGVHADNLLDFQEFMIVPVGAPSFSKAVQMGHKVFHRLQYLLKEAKQSTNVGDEGGFAPNIKTTREALDYLDEAIKGARFTPGEEITVAIDAAATQLYNDAAGRYCFRGEEQRLTTAEMVQYYQDLVGDYPMITSIEDGLAEDDWEGWKNLTKALGDKIQLVGDDLFVTNRERLLKGVQEKAANAILIKPNQIGTLTETLDVIHLARRHGYRTIISHRSGETEDTTIADLSVATNVGQIKIGSLSRSERVAKYNQLLRIEEDVIGPFNYGE